MTSTPKRLCHLVSIGLFCGALALPAAAGVPGYEIVYDETALDAAAVEQVRACKALEIESLGHARENQVSDGWHTIIISRRGLKRRWSLPSPLPK